MHIYESLYNIAAYQWVIVQYIDIGSHSYAILSVTYVFRLVMHKNMWKVRPIHMNHLGRFLWMRLILFCITFSRTLLWKTYIMDAGYWHEKRERWLLLPTVDSCFICHPHLVMTVTLQSRNKLLSSKFSYD